MVLQYDPISVAACFTLAVAGGASVAGGLLVESRNKAWAKVAQLKEEVAAVLAAHDRTKRGHANELATALDARDNWKKLHEEATTALARRQQEIAKLQRELETVKSTLRATANGLAAYRQREEKRAEALARGREAMAKKRAEKKAAAASAA